MELKFWIAGVVVLCAACPTPGESPSLASGGSAPAAPDEVLMNGVSSELFEHDQLRSRARAASLRLDRKSGTIVASKVEVERFGQAGQAPTGRLKAESARGQIRERDVVLEGKVELTDREDRKATTERAEYVEKEGLLRLPAEVRLAGENFEATGAAATYRLDSEKLEVSPPVRLVVRDSAR